MTALLKPSIDQLIEAHLDITEPQHEVQVEFSQNNTILWVHVDGVTVLRICRIPSLQVGSA